MGHVAARIATHRGDDVITACHEHPVAALPARDRGFGLAADDTHDPRAERASPLRQQRAHAAGSGMEQNVVLRLHAVSPAQQVFGRETFEHQCRALLIADGGRQLDQSRGRNIALLAVRPAGRLYVRHALPYAQAAHAAPQRDDDPGGLAPGYFRQRPRIQAAAVIDIDEVDADRRMAQLHFATRRRRELLALPLEHLGTAVLVEDYGVGGNRFHSARYSAALSVSPVRIRITRLMSVMNILPSPTLPVLAAFTMGSTTCPTRLPAAHHATPAL